MNNDIERILYTQSDLDSRMDENGCGIKCKV